MLEGHRDPEKCTALLVLCSSALDPAGFRPVEARHPANAGVQQILIAYRADFDWVVDERRDRRVEGQG